eukprot:Rhum_TRINITY_DN14688_c1_g1::Rhum_TRINITY_DN14688_c1_g1_i1::g.108867::m.108867
MPCPIDSKPLTDRAHHLSPPLPPTPTHLPARLREERTMCSPRHYQSSYTRRLQDRLAEALLENEKLSKKAGLPSDGGDAADNPPGGEPADNGSEEQVPAHAAAPASAAFAVAATATEDYSVLRGAATALEAAQAAATVRRVAGEGAERSAVREHARVVRREATWIAERMWDEFEQRRHIERTRHDAWAEHNKRARDEAASPSSRHQAHHRHHPGSAGQKQNRPARSCTETSHEATLRQTREREEGLRASALLREAEASRWLTHELRRAQATLRYVGASAEAAARPLAVAAGEAAEEEVAAEERAGRNRVLQDELASRVWLANALSRE